MERKRTSVFGIKGKLISAVAMLLVAVIMVVSSTYAWFTLSTAPEVRGIQTSIGANGALEIKLQGNVDGKIGETVIENTEYGNLIDLSDAAYGLDKIVLNPAVLNVNSTTGQIDLTKLLKYASYNHDTIGDGRPGDLLDNTTFGVYTDDNGFKVDDKAFGVRAIGLASGMTPEQIAYREAKGAANTAISIATTKAAQSLNANGSTLANAVVAYALDSNSTFAKKDVVALRSIVDSFISDGGILDSIEDAYVKLFIGFAASNAAPDGAYEAVKNYTVLSDFVEKNDKNLYVFKSTLSQYIPDTADSLLNGINALEITKANAASADEALETIETSEDYLADSTENPFSCTWAEFSAPLQYLINKDYVTVNEKTPSAIASDPNLLVNDVMNNLGINVQMNNRAGIYEEIADHCGDYTASIQLDVWYGSMNLTPKAKMTTVTDTKPSYLSIAKSAVDTAGAPSSESSSQVAALTEFYGYVIDLVFRTNAASSNLLLQVDATDRIYEDNPADAITQGGGSYMTFTSSDVDFTPDKVANMMSFIRIVFFDTDTGDIYGYAKLDATKYTVDEITQAVSAYMYMYKLANGYKYTSDDTTAYCSVVVETDENDATTYKFYKDADNKVVDDVATALWNANIAEGGANKAFDELFELEVNHEFKAIKLEKNGEDTVEVADNTIVALPQNAENGTEVSTLVYLDGSIENDDVPTTDKVTGKMNLQFASSANLVPMEYGDLHQNGATESGN